MTFGEKLKKLRADKGLTQDMLAEKIYVTRTAISKWESGRGYPNIESLKAIARFFSVTLDELLSSHEVLTIAEENRKQTARDFRNLAFGLVDICMSLVLFLPLFATKSEGVVQALSLLMLDDVTPYLKAAYYVVIIGTILSGVLTLALQKLTENVRTGIKTKLSLGFGVVSVLLFVISRQPYAAVYAFSLLVIKVMMLIKRT